MSPSRLAMTAIMAVVVAAVSSAQAAAPSSSPNAPGSANTTVQGFTSTALVLELSILLPQEAMRRGPAQAAPGQAPPGQTAPRRAPTGGQLGPRGGLPARDPKLFLTKDQADRLAPVLRGLRENPMPSPAKARRIEAEVASILTADQKAEIKRFRDAFAEARRRPAAEGPGQRMGPDLQSMSEEQRKDFIESLPPEQRQRLEERMRQSGANPRLSPLERRQRQLDLFLGALKEYRRGLGS
jgi:hypothetical protein